MYFSDRAFSSKIENVKAIFISKMGYIEGEKRMKRNPLIPFALIAVLGIGLMLLLSFQGLNKAEQIAEAKKNGGKATQTASKPEDIYKQTCIGCHGDQLQGGVGPNISKIGGKLSEDEIKNTILNGKGNMPPGLLPADQAAKMAKWLAEKK